jgi:hypothetical protein
LDSDNFVSSVKKSAIKRDGPVFLFSRAVTLKGNENTFFDIRSVDAWRLWLPAATFAFGKSGVHGVDHRPSRWSRLPKMGEITKQTQL